MDSVMLDRHRPDPRSVARPDAAARPADVFALWHDAEHVNALLRARILPRLCPQFLHARDRFDSEVSDARYHTFLKPTSAARSTMTVCYRLTAGTVLPQWITVRAFIDGGSARYHRMLRSQGIEALHLADLDTVAWCFPDDPALPQLFELLQAEGIAASLAGNTMTAAAAPFRLQVVKYRPMQRCAIEVRAARGTERPIAFAKVYSDARGERAGEQLRALATMHGSHLADVVVPTALGYDVQRQTLWLAHFDGCALDTHDLHGNNTDLIERLGRSVAHLHRMPLRVPQAPSPAALIAEACKKAAKIRRASARTGPLLDRAIACAAHAASRMFPAAPGCIHGDLHLGQWLRSADALMLADFDELAIGDPELDIANLGVDLQMRGMPAHTAGDVIERFVASYHAAGGRRLSMSRVRWYELLHWINRAYRLFLQQRPGLEAALGRACLPLLAACDALEEARR